MQYNRSRYRVVNVELIEAGGLEGLGHEREEGAGVAREALAGVSDAVAAGTARNMPTHLPTSTTTSDNHQVRASALNKCGWIAKQHAHPTCPHYTQYIELAILRLFLGLD